MKDETGRRLRGGAKRTGRGVYWRAERKCWAARIMVTSKGKERNVFLGHFDEEKDALRARAIAIENLEKDPTFYDRRSLQ